MLLSRSHCRLHTLGGVALAALLLVAHLSSFIHPLTVQHGICPEHGESIHVEPATGVTPAALGFELREVPRPASNHGHEHCLLMLPRREALTEPGSSTTAAHPVASWRVDRTVVFSPRRSIELLLLAPKSSPPA